MARAAGRSPAFGALLFAAGCLIPVRLPAQAAGEEATHVVAVPLADLRRQPEAVPGAAALKRPYDEDPLQETQLLYNERVRVAEERGAWARVEALEQPEFNHNDRWEGYPGWIPREILAPAAGRREPNAVVAVPYARLYGGPARRGAFLEIPLGARLAVTYEKAPWARVERAEGGDGWVALKDIRSFRSLSRGDELRKTVLKAARVFLGQPYYWGGRSSHHPGEIDRPTGVDCSGLVNLAYRVNGVDIPRDAHEQYMKSRPLSPAEMKPGDLIFLAKPSNPNRIVHVMIYAGRDRALEAAQEPDAVRSIPLKKRIGRSLRDVAPGEPAGDRHVYLGRLLPD
jgi:gamma-D-glutamyl-L-lysine dipeptidyl-peptidase